MSRHIVEQDPQAAVVFERDLQHPVHKVGVGLQLVQRQPEEFDLQVEVHAGWPIEADEARVNPDAGILPFRTGPVGRTSEINGIFGDECPVAIEDEWLELPILQSSAAQPDDVAGFAEPPGVGELCQFRAQTFVD